MFLSRIISSKVVPVKLVQKHMENIKYSLLSSSFMSFAATLILQYIEFIKIIQLMTSIELSEMKGRGIK